MFLCTTKSFAVCAGIHCFGVYIIDQLIFLNNLYDYETKS